MYNPIFRRYKVIVLALILLVISGSVFAIDNSLDTMLNSYYISSNRWSSYLYDVAKKLYWFWFTAELLYQITFKKVLANDVNKLWYFIMIRTFTGYMFLTIFVDPAFYSGVIQYFVKLGGEAGGFIVIPNSGNPFGSLSPTSILQSASDTWNSIYAFVKNLPDVLSGVTVGLPMILMAVGIYILMALMAFTLFMTALESYIVMNAGIILCGFAGSSWTMGFWNKYLSYVGGIAIRLFVMCLILGLINERLLADSILINTAGGDYLRAVAANTDTIAPLTNLMSAVIKLLVDMIICTFLVVKVPAMAGSMLTGTVNSGLGDVIAGASMVLAGAGLAAGLSKMGINLGGNGAGSGGNLKDTFKDTLRGNGGGGLPNVSGTSSSEGTRTASQTSQSSASTAEKSQGIAELSKDLKGTSASNNQGSQTAKNSQQSQTNSNKSNDNDSQNKADAKSPTTEAPKNSQSQSSLNKSTDNSSQKSVSEDYTSGGISGNDKSANNGSQNNNKTNNSAPTSRNEKQPSKAMQEMIKNKDSLIKTFDKMTTNSHSGSSEVNINPHRE